VSKSVLIVDDSQSVRKVVRSYFETLSDWTVKGEAEDGAQAIEKAMELRPNLILMDFSMPNLNGVEAASVLKKMLPDASIIVFTIFDDVLGSRISSAVGIDLVVSKAEGLTGLMKSIHQLLATAGLTKDAAETVRPEPRASDQS
jgi:DNA-binding NarL/FixJ family response regulator